MTSRRLTNGFVLLGGALAMVGLGACTLGPASPEETIRAARSTITQVATALEASYSGAKFRGESETLREFDGACWYSKSLRIDAYLGGPPDSPENLATVLTKALKEAGYEVSKVGADTGGWLVMTGTGKAGEQLSLRSKGYAILAIRAPVKTDNCTDSAIKEK